MKRQQAFLFFWFPVWCVIALVAKPFVSGADEITAQQPQYDLNSLIPVDSGMSTNRYATFGFGRYPYMFSMPGTATRITLDGVPLPAYSPFGADLESAPLQLMDSMQIDGMGHIDIGTIDVEEDVPVSTIGFLTGQHRRSVVEYSFARKTGARSGIVFGGSAYGAHAHEDTYKNSMRNYYLSLRQTLENKAEASLTLRGFRDRDGLVDLDRITYMGERKTDHMSVALGLKNYTIGEYVDLAGAAWYQKNNSRFHRHDYRKSLDDDDAGINVDVSADRGTSTYRLNVNHITKFFDSAIHDDSWTRNESRVKGFWSRRTSGWGFSLSGGLVYSSEYGGGSELAGEIVRLGPFDEELVIHANRYDMVPCTGMEYFTSLTFSDSAFVSDLDMYTLENIELGFRNRTDRFSWGVFGFGYEGDVPMLRPSSAVQDIMMTEGFSFSTITRMSETDKYYGGRWYLALDGGEKYIYALRSRGGIRFSRYDDDALWLYPSGDIFTEARVTRSFFGGKLDGTAFGSMEVLWWDEYYTGPQDSHAFIDIGISIKVSTLELFYKIENITNEDVLWFDTFGRLGANTVWGATWTLRK